jgi:hypothetical protein
MIALHNGHNGSCRFLCAAATCGVAAEAARLCLQYHGRGDTGRHQVRGQSCKLTGCLTMISG